MPTLSEDIELLNHPRSLKRRSAAKRLRKLADVRAGPELLEALTREVEDPRTWETQYQMIMALGECRYVPAIPLLKSLAGRRFEATMIYVALGDALVRLKYQSKEEADTVTEIMNSANQMFIDGAFRAMAMLEMVPRREQMREILRFVLALPLDSGLRFWPLAASAGWKTDEVDVFVSQCATSPRQDLREAAELAKQGRYRKWRPL